MNINKQDLINHRITKSKETIEDARLAIVSNRLRNSLNRIYYAIFYIVSALAQKDGFSTSKHMQLMGWFNKNYIKTGIVQQEFSKIYSLSFYSRQESDYEDFVEYNKEDIEKRYNDMLRFL
jgi:uncharacterized protein (UPF0332 family)